MKLQFRPRLLPTLCTAVLTPVLISLGLWQLDRADQKLQTMKRYEDRIAASAIPVGAQMETAGEMEFRKVSAGGIWDQKKEFLLDNRVLDSRAGYHVVTPLVLRDGKSAVLVNRGWIPSLADRTLVPNVPVIEGPSDVVGIAVIPPSEHFLLKNPEPIGESWPPVWQALDLNRFREAVEYRMHDFVIVLQSGHRDGFKYDWKMPDDAWIARHNAYAFQWFALAATLLVIYFVANLRRNNGRRSDVRTD